MAARVPGATARLPCHAEVVCGALTILNNGHTVQANYDPGSSIRFGNTTFDLLQVHYHAPSEHVTSGGRFDAEFHLVHQSVDDDYAVVAVLVTSGKHNDAFRSFIDNLPSDEAEESDTGESISALKMLPHDRSAYHYNGSLTTLPVLKA